MTAPLIGLSFDDGPDTINTPYVLSILAEENVKATFFLVGENAETYPHLVQRIHDEGHVIGNHSYSHPDFSGLNYTQALNEIASTNDIIENITGVRPSLLRFPYGNTSTTADLAKQTENMTDVLWHWDNTPTQDMNGGIVFDGDWVQGNTTRAVVNYITGNAHEQGVILLHDAGGPHGAEFGHFSYLRHSIRILKDDGFEFGKLEVGSGPSLPNMNSWVEVVPA